MLEKSCGWWLIWYFLFFCHGGAEGQLQWVVKEKITDYGQDLTLFCPVENCCSKHQAGWFVGGKSKILDVKTFSNDPNSKYHGTYNTDGIGFVIRNLSEADLNVTYHCNYGFNESTPTLLLHGDVFKESVPDKDKDEENNTRTKVIIAIVGCIIGAVGLIIIAIGIIVYCVRRKKREKPPGRKKREKPPDEVPLMEVVGSPTVEVHQSSYSVTTGKKVTLVCTVSSSRRINDVYWQRNIGGSITFMNFDTKTRKYSGSTTTTPSLTIFNASSSDAGTYTCWAINDVGKGRSTTTTLSVTENSPSNQEEVPVIEVVPPGQPRNVEVNVLSLNRIEVSWLPPTDSASITSYNIYFNDLSVMEDQDNNHVLEGLIPDTVYQIQVSAITNDIEGEKSPMIEVKTSPFVVYRVDVNFTNILYTKQLDDRNSNEFKSLAEDIQKHLTALFVSIPGKQTVGVTTFKKGSLLTTFDLTSRGYYEESVLRETIEKPLRDGRIGSYKASPEGFTFRSFGVAVVYRVDITVTVLSDTKQLDNGNSNEFKRSAEIIQKGLTGLFGSVPGIQEVVFVKYKPGSLLTTFDLTSLGYYGESVLRETIEKPLRDERIGSYKASPVGFTFRAFSGDFHGAIVEKYRTEPKIPRDLLKDKEFLSKLLEECGKNTEGLLPYSSGGIDVVYFPATLLVVVMKYRPETEIVKEVVKDMFTTLKSQPPSTVVIVYHRSVKTAMEKVPEKERKKHILEEFIEDHKFDYSASPWLHQFMDCLKKNDPKV